MPASGARLPFLLPHAPLTVALSQDLHPFTYKTLSPIGEKKVRFPLTLNSIYTFFPNESPTLHPTFLSIPSGGTLGISPSSSHGSRVRARRRRLICLTHVRFRIAFLSLLPPPPFFSTLFLLPPTGYRSSACLSFFLPSPRRRQRRREKGTPPP